MGPVGRSGRGRAGDSRMELFPIVGYVSEYKKFYGRGTGVQAGGSK